MNISNNGLNLIASFEGFRADAYQDIVGVWTIGYGHTHGVFDGQSVTVAEALEMLRDDVTDAVHTVDATVTVPLTQNQFDALVSFVFNCGAGNFHSSTLLRYLNGGQYGSAALEFVRWNEAGGHIVEGLTKRREAEAALFQTK